MIARRREGNLFVLVRKRTGKEKRQRGGRRRSMSRMSITARSMQCSTIAEGGDIGAHFHFPRQISLRGRERESRRDKRARRRDASAGVDAIFNHRFSAFPTLRFIAFVHVHSRSRCIFLPPSPLLPSSRSRRDLRHFALPERYKTETLFLP